MVEARPVASAPSATVAAALSATIITTTTTTNRAKATYNAPAAASVRAFSAGGGHPRCHRSCGGMCARELHIWL